MGKVKMPFETWEGVMQSHRELEARAEKAEAKLRKVRDELGQTEPMNDSEWRRALRQILNDQT